jgi:hypothetical protein
MKAIKSKDLTISVPNMGCDKNCLYCISKVIGPMDSNYDLMLKQLPKVKHLAEASEVLTVLFTSKGEPLLNLNAIMELSQPFRDWPLELQTNGVLLANSVIERTKEMHQVTDLLSLWHFNTIAFSLDYNTDFKLREAFAEVFKYIKSKGMNVRLCINITDHFHYLDFSGLWKGWLGPMMPYVSQVLFRRIDMPSYVNNVSEVTRWVQEHATGKEYDRLKIEAEDYIRSKGLLGLTPIKHLLDGNKVYDLEGIAVTFSDYCIQESHATDDIHSLILMEDGHVYTNWNSKASIIF